MAVSRRLQPLRRFSALLADNGSLVVLLVAANGSLGGQLLDATRFTRPTAGIYSRRWLVGQPLVAPHGPLVGQPLAAASVSLVALLLAAARSPLVRQRWSQPPGRLSAQLPGRQLQPAGHMAVSRRLQPLRRFSALLADNGSLVVLLVAANGSLGGQLLDATRFTRPTAGIYSRRWLVGQPLVAPHGPLVGQPLAAASVSLVALLLAAARAPLGRQRWSQPPGRLSAQLLADNG